MRYVLTVLCELRAVEEIGGQDQLPPANKQLEFCTATAELTDEEGARERFGVTRLAMLTAAKGTSDAMRWSSTTYRPNTDYVGLTENPD